MNMRNLCDSPHILLGHDASALAVGALSPDLPGMVSLNYLTEPVAPYLGFMLCVRH